MIEFSPTASDVSDACDLLGIDAARSGSLRPAWEVAPPIAGVLRTVRLAPRSGSSPLEELLELVASGGAVVWLFDLGGRVDYQCFGSRVASAAQRAGVPGALVNGAVRDVDELRALRFPTFACGVFPGAMKGRLQIDAVDEHVEVDDIVVRSGSYVVADASGLVAFSAGHLDKVVATAGDLRRADQARLGDEAGR